jgi:universal stress protein A
MLAARRRHAHRHQTQVPIAHEKEDRIMLAIRTILHPTDFSPYSNYAFRLACSLARDYGAKVVVLHVAEPPMAFATEGVLIQPPETHLESIREELEQVRPNDPNFPVEHRLVQGESVAEILAVADEIKSDVIVLGTHGRTGLGRLLMGSVAEQVVRQAKCPVLTVKTPLAKAVATAPPAVAAQKAMATA